MGNKNSCCAYSSPSQGHKDVPHFEAYSPEGEESIGNLQHISEREPEDCDSDPSLHPMAGTIFMERSKASIENGMIRKRSQNHLVDPRPLKKSSSCSTIYLDDSTVSQPNLKNTVKCVALAIYYHIKNRTSQRHISIFDEKLHPLTRDGVIDDYDKHNPEHRQIYKFVRTLFNAAQLTAECAIITLVYLERNELERQFLEMLQFNINVPSSVYAKYYFDLRTLAEANDLSFPSEPLSKDRAQKLEAMSRVCEDKVTAEALRNGHKKWSSVDNVSVGGARRSVAILS
uniref:Uncharacterized protein n=2 Tax=Timema TaxID=61471 RepID=A0A7R9CLB5_TIMPO|nr:unnamed protein product [Timema poppensis]CAD7400834.1 unnamed protein product [Timema cristinae]